MQLSKDTKRFLLLLSTFSIGLVICVTHFSFIMGWLAGALAVIMPFILGACLAFVLSVPMRMFSDLLGHKGKKGRPLLGEKARQPVSLLLAIALVILLVVLFSVIVLPQLVDAISSLAMSVTRFVPQAQEWLNQAMAKLDNYPELRAGLEPYVPDLGQLASTAVSFIQRYAGKVMATLVSQASALFGKVTDVLIAFVFAVYMLLQKQTLSRQCKKLMYAFLPRHFCDKALRVASLTHRTFFSYVAIQCTEAMILGALCFVGMLILRFPYALVISVIMLFCALIPIYGAIISCVVGAFLVLTVSPTKALWFVVFILVLQQIETNLIYPRVVSTSINLPSMWVLMVVTAGGGIFGLPGMLLAVPVMSVVYTLLGEETNGRLAQKADAIRRETQRPVNGNEDETR